MTNRIISSQIEKTYGNYRAKLGCIDRTNTTSAYINLQARVKMANGMDIDSNFRRFRSILNPWLYQNSRDLFNGLKFNLIKSVEYSDSNTTHSNRSKTVLNFEVTFLFDKQICFGDEFNKFDEMCFRLTNFFNTYEEMEIVGSIK